MDQILESYYDSENPERNFTREVHTIPVTEVVREKSSLSTINIVTAALCVLCLIISLGVISGKKQSAGDPVQTQTQSQSFAGGEVPRGNATGQRRNEEGRGGFSNGQPDWHFADHCSDCGRGMHYRIDVYRLDGTANTTDAPD